MAHPDFPEARLRALVVSTRLTAISDALIALAWLVAAAAWISDAFLAPPLNGAFLVMVGLILAGFATDAAAEFKRRKHRLAFQISQTPSLHMEFYLTLGAFLLAVVTGVAGILLDVRALEVVSDLLVAALLLLWAADQAHRSWAAFRVARLIVPTITDELRNDFRHGLGHGWGVRRRRSVKGRIVLARSYRAVLWADVSHPRFRYLDWIPSEAPATERTPA